MILSIPSREIRFQALDQDNDYVVFSDAEVRFEQTHYTINEGDNSLEVCTLLINPPNNETLAMDIDFDATTSTASAGIFL